MQKSRRKFLMKLGLSGLTAISFPSLLSAINNSDHSLKNTNDKGLTILFQGDSITHGNRTLDNDWNHVMGHGYAYLIASRLWYDYPEKDLMFYNRGVSGDKVSDLVKRWDKDTINLKPDVLSILIGVNDVSKIVANEYSIEDWNENYKKLLDRTKKELPNTILILCEPFLLPEDWTVKKTGSRQNVIQKMQKFVRQQAKDYNAIFVELQEPFNRACNKAPAKYWIWDTVHPMPAGHELIARLWIKEFSKNIDLNF